jgi:hypothetical protein
MPIGSAVANLRNELSSRTETLHSRESLLNYLFKHQHRSQFFKSHAILFLAYTFLRNSETPNLINSTTLSLVAGNRFPSRLHELHSSLIADRG